MKKLAKGETRGDLDSATFRESAVAVYLGRDGAMWVRRALAILEDDMTGCHELSTEFVGEAVYALADDGLDDLANPLRARLVAAVGANKAAAAEQAAAL